MCTYQQSIQIREETNDRPERNNRQTTIVARDFNSLLLVIDRQRKHKTIKDIIDLNNTINQLDLIFSNDFFSSSNGIC